MSDNYRDGKLRESSRSSSLRPSRRRFLQATAAAGAITSVGTGLAQEDEEEPDIVLDGDTPGWVGIEPEEIEGETDPTLNLVEGETYVLLWENVDGEPHNVVIEDADENTILETEVITERGATQTVEFEATQEMAQYYCEVHPVSMRGDINLGEETDEVPAEEAKERFFPEGPAVGVQTVAEGMTAPADFAVPPGDDDRMFVADQTGELWVVAEDGRQEEPFLDVTDEMVAVSEEFAGGYADPEGDYDERGLLGIEFHPDYAENGRLFVNYSAPPDDRTPDGWSHVQVVSEVQTTDPGDEQPADVNPDSERRIMEFESPQYNHNAGPMAFGPDGYLYVPMGDGGGANDEMYGHVDDWYGDNAGGNGQDTRENLHGGIHRIDVDADPTESPRTTDDGEPDGDEGYAIPDDNPLVDYDDHRSEYHSWGWRNPYGISFDQDDRLMVADAGQALFETAYEVEMGGNYAWNVKEGTQCFSTESPGEPPKSCPDFVDDDVPDPRGGEPLLEPEVEYPQNFRGRKLGIVIIGGHVYEGDTIGELEGTYIFGDWTQDVARQTPRGRVFAATIPDYGEDQDVDEVPEFDEDDVAADPDPSHADFLDPEDSPVPTDQLWEMQELVFDGSENGKLHRFVRQFGRDRDGEVYVLVNEIGIPEGDTGAVLKLVPPEEGEEIEAADEADTDDEDVTADEGDGDEEADVDDGDADDGDADDGDTDDDAADDGDADGGE